MTSKPSKNPQSDNEKTGGMNRRSFLKLAGAGTVIAGGAALYSLGDSRQEIEHAPERNEQINALANSINVLNATIGTEMPEHLPDALSLGELAQRCVKLNALLKENPTAMVAYGQTRAESALSARTPDPTLRALGTLSAKDAACFQEYLVSVRGSVSSVLQSIRACPDAYLTSEITSLEQGLQAHVKELDEALQGRIRNGQTWMSFAKQNTGGNQPASENNGVAASIIQQGKKVFGMNGVANDPLSAERLALESELVSDDKKVQDNIASVLEAVNTLQQHVLVARVKETWDRQVHPSLRARMMGIVGVDPASAERRKLLEDFVREESKRRELLFALLRILHHRDVPLQGENVISQPPATDRQTRARHEMALLIDSKKTHLHTVLGNALQTLEDMESGNAGKIEKGWSELFGIVHAFSENVVSKTGSDSMLPEEVTGPLMSDAFDALDMRLAPHLETARPFVQKLTNGDTSVTPQLEQTFRVIDEELMAFCRQLNEGMDTAAQRAAILEKFATYFAIGAAVLVALGLAGPQIVSSAVRNGVRGVSKLIPRVKNSQNKDKESRT